MSTGECSPDGTSADRPTTHDVGSTREVSLSPLGRTGGPRKQVAVRCCGHEDTAKLSRHDCLDAICLEKAVVNIGPLFTD